MADTSRPRYSYVAKEKITDTEIKLKETASQSQLKTSTLEDNKFRKQLLLYETIIKMRLSLLRITRVDCIKVYLLFGKM